MHDAPVTDGVAEKSSIAARSSAKVWITDLQVMDYQEACGLQQRISDAKTDKVLDPDVILVLEHLPVFTLGKRGS